MNKKWYSVQHCEVLFQCCTKMYIKKHFNKWATSQQNQQNSCTPSGDSDQPGYPPSLIRVFAVRMKNHLLYWCSTPLSTNLLLLLLCWCFTTLRHILGNCGRGQLTYPHSSWASLLGSLPALSAHSFASNWQLPFLNQRKEENGRRNYFITKLHERMLPDVRIEPATELLCPANLLFSSTKCKIIWRQQSQRS